MRFESAHGARVPKVGFGTWSIGGEDSPDASRDARSLTALRSALELGYSHFDTAESYARGHCEELLGRAIREVSCERSSLFITSKVKPENLTAARVLAACEASLNRLNMEYIDLYLIHWPNRGLQLEDSFEGLNALVRAGKVRHVGVSNFDLQLLRSAHHLCETPLFTNQLPFSLFERSHANDDMLAFCRAHQILLTAYSPLKDRRLRTDARIGQVAAGRGLTRWQVGIAWLCTQPQVITIPMSASSEHQKQNLEAGDVVLTPEEMHKLR